MLRKTSTSLAVEPDGAFLAPRHAWFLVGALSLASMVAYVDRQILTLMFGPIKADLQLSDTQVSLLAGLAFVVCYSVFGLVSGWLADRQSRKALVAAGIVFWSLATVSCGAAGTFLTLFLARMAVGVGESTLAPAAMSLITDAFPREKLARAMSVFTGATFVGMGLALVLGGAGIGIANSLIESGNPLVAGFRPWQLAFILIGAVGGLAVIPVLFLREPHRVGQGGVPAASASSAAPTVPAPPLGRFITANRAALGFLWVGYSLNAMAGVGTMSWTPAYFMRVGGMTAAQIGLAYGLIISVVGLIGVSAGPSIFAWLRDRGMKDGYVVFPLICFALGAIPSVIAFSVDSVPLALTLIGFKQLVMTLPMPIMAMSMQIIAPSQLRGRIYAIYLFMGNILAAALGPISVALFTDYVFQDESLLGYSVIANTVMLVPLAALCLLFAVRPYRKCLADADAGFTRTY